MSSEDFKKSLERKSEVNITTIGRKSSKPRTNTVWFVQEQNKVYLLPVSGSKSQWFKNIQAKPRIVFASEKNEIQVEAKPSTDKKFVEGVKKKFEAKYDREEIEKYYTGFDAAVEVTI